MNCLSSLLRCTFLSHFNTCEVKLWLITDTIKEASCHVLTDGVFPFFLVHKKQFNFSCASLASRGSHGTLDTLGVPCTLCYSLQAHLLSIGFLLVLEAVLFQACGNKHVVS